MTGLSGAKVLIAGGSGFIGANLIGANLSEALGIQHANFGRATADEHTAWPEGFNPNFRIPYNSID